MFLPSKWPTYFKSSKGCTVTDLQKKKYFDFNMGGYKLFRVLK